MSAASEQDGLTAPASAGEDAISGDFRLFPPEVGSEAPGGVAVPLALSTAAVKNSYSPNLPEKRRGEVPEKSVASRSPESSQGTHVKRSGGTEAGGCSRTRTSWPLHVYSADPVTTKTTRRVHRMYPCRTNSSNTSGRRKMPPRGSRKSGSPNTIRLMASFALLTFFVNYCLVEQRARRSRSVLSEFSTAELQLSRKNTPVAGGTLYSRRLADEGSADPFMGEKTREACSSTTLHALISSALRTANEKNDIHPEARHGNRQKTATLDCVRRPELPQSSFFGAGLSPDCREVQGSGRVYCYEARYSFPVSLGSGWTAGRGGFHSSLQSLTEFLHRASLLRWFPVPPLPGASSSSVRVRSQIVRLRWGGRQL